MSSPELPSLPLFRGPAAIARRHPSLARGPAPVRRWHCLQCSAARPAGGNCVMLIVALLTRGALLRPVWAQQQRGFRYPPSAINACWRRIRLRHQPTSHQAGYRTVSGAGADLLRRHQPQRASCSVAGSWLTVLSYGLAILGGHRLRLLRSVLGPDWRGHVRDRREPGALLPVAQSASGTPHSARWSA